MKKLNKKSRYILKFLYRFNKFSKNDYLFIINLIINYIININTIIMLLLKIFNFFCDNN